MRDTHGGQNAPELPHLGWLPEPEPYEATSLMR